MHHNAEVAWIGGDASHLYHKCEGGTSDPGTVAQTIALMAHASASGLHVSNLAIRRLCASPPVLLRCAWRLADDRGEVVLQVAGASA